MDITSFWRLRRAAFNDRTLNSVLYYTVSIKEVGVTGKWYQLNVSIPFKSDSYE